MSPSSNSWLNKRELDKLLQADQCIDITKNNLQSTRKIVSK